MLIAATVPLALGIAGDFFVVVRRGERQVVVVSHGGRARHRGLLWAVVWPHVGKAAPEENITARLQRDVISADIAITRGGYDRSRQLATTTVVGMPLAT